MRKIPVLTGPTGSGKSSLALSFAQRHNLALLSADSIQIYRGLDIGSAKATAKEREEVLHLGLDLVSMSESFSVAAWLQFARPYVEQAISLISHASLSDEAMHAASSHDPIFSSLCDEKKTGISPQPLIICGGTPQYVSGLVEGLTYENQAFDPQLREALLEECEKKGLETLYQRLMTLDPERAKMLSSRDQKRILRALELIELTGQKASSLKIQSQVKANEHFAVFLIDHPRDVLYERINFRVDQMLAEGLLDEAKIVYEAMREGQLSTTAQQAIAYKEFFPFFSGDADFQSCVEKLKQNSRRYAKRQLSWWCGKDYVHWIDAKLGKNYCLDFLEKACF